MYVSGFAEDEDGDTFAGNGDVAANGGGAAAKKAALLKDYGKESRHNVISRKDNLILVPDKPERQASKEWATKALAGKEVSAATLESQGCNSIDNRHWPKSCLEFLSVSKLIVPRT